MKQAELFSMGEVRPAKVGPGEVEAWCLERGLMRVIGVDEAGRGPLAGPVVAAAVCMDLQRLDEPWVVGLDDSKKLKERDREALFEAIIEGVVAYGIAEVDSVRIDEINILQATFEAMRQALSNSYASLDGVPDLVMIDGNMTIPGVVEEQRAFIKGDGRSLHIAAASILAKVTRDRLMIEQDRRWPEYGFASHKGYGTAAHRRAIEAHGPCPIHRLSFGGVKEHIPRLRG